MRKIEIEDGEVLAFVVKPSPAVPEKPKGPAPKAGYLSREKIKKVIQKRMESHQNGKNLPASNPLKDRLATRLKECEAVFDLLAAEMDEE